MFLKMGLAKGGMEGQADGYWREEEMDSAMTDGKMDRGWDGWGMDNRHSGSAKQDSQTLWEREDDNWGGHQGLNNREHTSLLMDRRVGWRGSRRGQNGDKAYRPANYQIWLERGKGKESFVCVSHYFAEVWLTQHTMHRLRAQLDDLTGRKGWGYRRGGPEQMQGPGSWEQAKVTPSPSNSPLSSGRCHRPHWGRSFNPKRQRGHPNFQKCYPCSFRKSKEPNRKKIIGHLFLIYNKKL